jgi:hypothetical protein
MVARHLRAALLACSALSLAGAASAQVFQSDAAQTPLPQPVGMAEVVLATDSWAYKTTTQVNRDATGMNVNGMTFGDYYPTFADGDAITLGGLFKFRGENIDPVADARTAPGYFSPSCGFSGELVLRGGDCEIKFGWYNVEDPNSTTAPTPDEIYPFLPEDVFLDAAMTMHDTMKETITYQMACQPPLSNGFCPLAWDNVDPRQLDKKLWTRRAYDSGKIKQDPRYKGKYVGFAVIGNPSKLCSQNKYSMMEHNQRNAQGKAWVTTLIYQSTVDPEGFYMAFEDLPMAPDDWHKTGVNGNNATNDGDFNDFVFYVSGINCLGGGMPCTVPDLQGACSLGRTDCATEGTTGMCRPIIAPGAELCDNVDNDCNGVVDEGAGLCPGTQVCDKGKCIEACGTGEFRCLEGFTCRTGSCIENACVDVVCEAGQVCRAGVCANACDNTVCPSGQECQLGRCVDPCAAVECAAGKVCERGLCVSDCSCRGCKDGLVCGADGRCADPACANVMCEAGKKCAAGACVDSCEGVMCPSMQVCVNGSCMLASGSGGTSSIGGTDGGIDFGGGLSLGGSNGTGANSANNGKKPDLKDPGCACDVVGRSPASGAALLVGGLAVVLLGARRRRQAA